jgi:hypothetical protein
MDKKNTAQNILNLLKSKSVIIWDNDGTIMGTKDLNDRSHERIILPNVQEIMNTVPAVHIICSGFKSAETEKKNYDTEGVIKRFSHLMHKLPINAAVFSPAIGGVECWELIKNESGEIEIRKAHDDARYTSYIGHFKKPDTGMFVVIKDIVKKFGLAVKNSDFIMIGDTLQDQQFAENAGIDFVYAQEIHKLPLITA